MSLDFVIEAEPRLEQGSSASRRLRRAGKLPAILYGGHADPVAITLDHNAILLNLKHDAFYSHILTVNLNGKSERAILRDVQRHPFKPTLVHVDLLRVSADEAIRVHVPLSFVNEDICKGVKTGGGMINRQLTEVEIECLPGNLPETIEVDVADLGVGDSLHLSDLALPEGVTVVALVQGGDHDTAVVSVLMPRGEKAASEEGEEPESGAEGV
ncbi:50S ribosomal protein L25/general stress protein Ctc [Thioalkalivibrio paradoxus]|uniref:Large ribosomal subunit protein bL25 n=1 Tax=Thioalkalivibrio paradoxus ARh 1 TaxID=713585 RepID=W0DQ12_9GAMM|nr:50S ribosomal protein L25/general stress protein Ctc [Thioalkalivibrio paradoxus]AHE99332.1 50S ribosomal protein L25 [Thioalkalivibrio paradoxus ARh 1]